MSASVSIIKSLLISLCMEPNHENMDTPSFLFFFGIFFCFFLVFSAFLIHFIFVHPAVSVPSSFSLKNLWSSVFSMTLFLESFIVTSKLVRDVFTFMKRMDFAMILSSSVKYADIE